MPVRILVLAIGILATTCISGAAAAADCAAGKLMGAAAALSDWSDDRPGRCRRLLPGDLLPPSKSNTSFSKIVAVPTGVLPRVPPGFQVTRLFRSGAKPRLIRTAPNGDVFVAESAAGQIRVLRPSSTCSVGTTALFATGLDRPFGIAFYPAGDNPQYVYVAENSRVVRYPYTSGALAPGGAAEVVVARLPQGAGALQGKGHWTRDVAFSADGKTMYVSVGSYSNVQQSGEDETERAAILSFTPTGGSRKIFASGLRNPVSLSIQPVTGALWTTVNERDGLGDELVPDYVTRVRRGEFYGWPWYYIGQRRDTRPGTALPGSLPPVAVPKVLLQAHTASLGSAFYTGSQFPAEYRYSLFIAAHGSWNRANPTGSKVIRLAFDAAGNAARYYEDFMTGFTVSNHNVWSRPVGIAVGKDGSLFVSEDANNYIYCVSYTG
ncbi:MAG: PQQ-dependent sugar dehydrogenase [Geminicoccaceae bacterium]